MSDRLSESDTQQILRRLQSVEDSTKAQEQALKSQEVSTSAQAQMLKAQGETLARITALIERFVAVETRQAQREKDLTRVISLAENNQLELAEWRAYRTFFVWGIGAVGSAFALVLGLLIKSALGGG